MAGEPAELEIDLLREYALSAVIAHLESRRAAAPELPASEIFTARCTTASAVWWSNMPG